ncbi:hydroxypyruvate isomerase family protein [Peristeroidobacter soli]|uniref:hydroxypyruvate isomerase family protein n=1 Tax=Peristeroidobacter soli TaxID=2497877 RepID=UPI001C378D32|nr:TIM barrel protein [Peristeroidobacter soli]
MISRRTLLHSSLSATALAAMRPLSAAPPKRKFKLKFAPHLGQFVGHAGEDIVDQLTFLAGEGFTVLEDNEMMQRSVSTQETIARTLRELGMSLGVFVVAVGGNQNRLFTTGHEDNPRKFARACQDAVAVAKRVNARWMTVVPGVFDRTLPIGLQTANAIDVLRAGAEVFERENLVMVIEPLADSPDLFLRTADQAYELCRAVNSPACKILFDMYHLQQNQGSIMTSIDQVWSEIGYFQIGDVPGRLWPGTGEMNYRNILEHIFARMRRTGRDFIFGMEHGPWKPDKAAERACIESYAAIEVGW